LGRRRALCASYPNLFSG